VGFACLGVKNEVVYEMSQGLMEKLAVEAFEVAMVSRLLSFVYFLQLLF
jgi:hypothetical protein